MRKKSANASEVAKLAGVSQSTVSRVFTPGLKVSEKTKEKVLEAAKSIGYRPNALARGLIMNKSNMIGIAMKENKNPFYNEVLGEFAKGLREKGYQILFVYTENEEVQQEEIFQFLEYNVEGIIVTDAFLSSNIVSSLHENHIPFVLFNRFNQNVPCHSVSCDNYAAANEIGGYLYEKGYRKLAYITGQLNTSTNIDRQKGFFDAMALKGLVPEVEEGNYTYEGGYAAALNLLKMKNRPDAIFCANDITAFGAIDAIKSSGLSMPGDIAVIGFDNIEMAEWPSYALTTWEQPMKEMVELTIEKLLNEINGELSEPIPLLVKGKLIKRKTV